MSKDAIWVYVAGPYTSDPQPNTDRAGEIGVELRELAAEYGLKVVPIIPHLSHYLPERDYEFWMDWDFEYIRRCDAVLRWPGESSGADREAKFALELGIPVFATEVDLIRWALPGIS